MLAVEENMDVDVEPFISTTGPSKQKAKKSEQQLPVDDPIEVSSTLPISRKEGRRLKGQDVDPIAASRNSS
ncbi:hypothetical protein DFH09DRAFT_1325951 [Mycena vulgaris]|nr:hypothetical protein DFH09DRAFT_1325951 [Mycena vulgaris]